jgi:membrane protease YdiL (CAAX protease family)
VNNPPKLSSPDARDETYDNLNVAAAEAYTPAAHTADADAPPLSVATAIALWVMSIALVFVVQSVVLVLYTVISQGVIGKDQILTAASSPAGIVVQVLANLPAFLLTLMLIWWVTTAGGRHSFWQAISWKRHKTTAWWVVTGILLWAASFVLTYYVVKIFGAKETTFEQLIRSSPGARLAIVALAVLGAPLVEEIVYRGVVYPALERAFGVAQAIIGVAALFTLVHVPQYWNNPGLIVGLAFLSIALTIVRARTGSVLPCFIIHLVFNSISSIGLLLESASPQPPPDAPQTIDAAASFILWIVSSARL